MAAANFPNTPALNDTHTHNGKTYKWDGGSWISLGDQIAISQVVKNGDYTLVLGDAGNHIYHTSADNFPRTYTIPANSSVAYVIGTVITFVNRINILTIAINTDTMYLAGAGTTGSRTLAANGIATALKISSTEWIISGTGLT